MTRKTLSVVLATYNEEANLAGCIDSVKDLANEIIIVDGSSTDKTVEIAKTYGAIVKVTTNKPNFHINKQMAIDMATKDWILQLDGDEHISPELKDEIIQILNGGSSFLDHESSIVNHTSDVNGYWMPRKNWFLGRFLMKGGQYPDYTLRFYRNGKGRLPQKDVHEQAVVDGKVGYLRSALLHYPYKDFSHYLNKWTRYNRFFAGQIKEEMASKNLLQKFLYAILYLLVKPAHWLLTTFIRHKGFVDGWQGFVFSFFSALRFPVSYIIYLTG
jgi:glycosyltransferase involved in cell wall biosynthesis